jgi:nitric oxide reductase subunit B
MQTLPQINMYSHGTQLAASHGHMAFFGAYVATNLAVAYIMVQKIRDPEEKYVFDSKLWKWAYVLMIIGLVGMVGALMVAGFAQTEIERAVGGSGWQAYIDAQLHPWMAEAMWWRLGFGFIFFIGYILLIIDLLTIGKNKEELEPLPEEGLSHA